MRYLITGGAGFIGSHLVDRLVERGDSVVILDDLSTGRRSNINHLLGSDRVEFVEGSVLDERLVGECMRRADVCMHLASAGGVKLIVREPLQTLLNNMRGTDVVLDAAARLGKRLLFTSTSEVYGKHSGGLLSESSDRILGSPFKARWGYAITKSLGEALVHSYCLAGSCDMVAVRLFNTVGPRQTAAYGMVLPRFVRQALSGDDVTVYGDGTQSRCFVHVFDTTRAIVAVSDAPGASGNVYNIGSSAEISIVGLARTVIDRAGSSSRIRFVSYDDAYGEEFEELGRRRPDTSSLERLTAWRPTLTLEQTIDDLIEQEALSLARRVPPAGAVGSRAGASRVVATDARHEARL